MILATHVEMSFARGWPTVAFLHEGRIIEQGSPGRSSPTRRSPRAESSPPPLAAGPPQRWGPWGRVPKMALPSDYSPVRRVR